MIDVARKDEQGFFFNTTYAYDNAGRVTDIKHYRDGDVIPFTEYIYGYDQADRIIEQTTAHDPAISAFSAVPNSKTEDFTFDDAGQLTNYYNQAGGGFDFASYEYDDNGNRVRLGSYNYTSPIHTIGDYNRLDEDADWDYTYDPEGNLTRKDAVDPNDDSFTLYTYDHRNRLTSVTDYANAIIITDSVEYSYNANDQMVRRNLYLYDEGSVQEIVTSHQIYDGPDMVLDIDPEQGQRHRYLWADAVDMLLADDRPAQTYWAATDHLGTVRDLVDSNENISEHREYDSFGAIDAVFDIMGQSTSGESLWTDIGYTGQLFDSQIGLQFNNARWYDSHTGRFLSEDPIQDGSNWYAYAGNDPINFSDPTGLSQAGNPLNALAGGYSGGVVGAAPKPINFNTSLLASPTLNYNSSKSSYAYGPVRSTNTLSGLGNIALRTASSTVRNYNPIATSVVNAGLGLGAASLGSITPIFSGSIANSVSNFFSSRSDNLQRRDQEFAARQQQVAVSDAALTGLHGSAAQRSANRADDQQIRQSDFSVGPVLVGAVNQRLSGDMLLGATGLTSREAALGITKRIIGATGQQITRSDAFLAQQPGFQMIQGGVEVAANPFTYAVPAALGATRLAPLRLLDDAPVSNSSRFGQLREASTFLRDEAGITSRAYRRQVIESFGNDIRVETFSGQAFQYSGGAGPLSRYPANQSRYLSPRIVDNPVQDLALPSRYNSATLLQQFDVLSTRVLRGTVAPQKFRGRPVLSGGAEQIFVPNTSILRGGNIVPVE